MPLNMVMPKLNMIEVVDDSSQGGTYNEVKSLVIKLSQRALYDEFTHVNKPITSSTRHSILRILI